MKPWHTRIGIRIFLAIVGLNLFLSLCVSLAMYAVLENRFFQQFRQNNLALARSLAGAIDAERHRSFRSLDSLEDPYYQELLTLFRAVETQHPHIAYVYSLNYDGSEEEFFYAVDATEISGDTIWIESSAVSFFLQRRDETDFVLVYNETEQADDFQAPNGTRVHWRAADRTLLINDEAVFQVTMDGPTRVIPLVNDSSGRLLDHENRELEVTLNDSGGSVEWSLSFSGADDPGSDPGSGYVDDDSTIADLIEMIDENRDEVDKRIYSSSYGDFISAHALIRDRSGQPVGMVTLDVSAASVLAFRKAVLWLSVIVFGLAAMLSVLLSYFLTRYITRPIKELSGAVREIGQGNLKIVVNWESTDEFGDLARSMNGMANSLDEARSRILRINEAFRRFVPADFLQFLRREDVTEVCLGDQVLQDLTILFSDIRSFTTISEGVTPQENFEFINAYLRRMGPEIRGQHGFIDKYIGDAIMALFPRTPEDAVLAAISMQRTLRNYNEERVDRGYLPIRIGVGIHSGQMMLGIVGEEMRMDGTVISDAVNVASRLETLTKTFRCRILISADVRAALSPELNDDVRYVGRLQVRGKSNYTEAYEVFAGDPLELQQQKRENRERFEEAVRLLAGGDAAAAKQIFVALHAKADRDDTLRVFIEQCDRRIAAG